MHSTDHKSRGWGHKFRNAFRGLAVAVRRHNSFWVHGAFAVGVIIAGVVVGVQTWQWCALVLCIALVLAAEMLNTALEEIAKAVDPSFNPHIRDALDMGSAAVLLAAAGSVITGAIVFLLG